MYNTAWLGRAGSSQLAGLRACLDKADEWVFDVFELERESEGRPLQARTYCVSHYTISV